MDRADSQRVVGTAGHIDHGKTALIRALTGVETDRLPEEQKRGISIELGFAPLDLPGGLRLDVVDVPGHEGLVRTMVAGAAGIDLVLLVVAADEGVMPQTREHLAICELLGVTRAVVALTKIDLTPGDLADLAEADVEDHLSRTGLAGAPIVRVSSVTGEGLEELRKELVSAAENTRPRTPRSGPARLPIDRCFAMKGFGSIVTGTLVGDVLRVDDAVEIQPSGRQARIRGLQRHGEPVDRVDPGARCAINLQGIDVADLSRGEVVIHPDSFAATTVLDVALDWLEAAPAAEQAIAVEFLSGTSERRARVGAIGSRGLVPGSSGFARIHIDGDPVALVPGDRFILRGFARIESGGRSLGGGIVLDTSPPRRRRSDPSLLEDLEILARREPTESLALRIRRGGLSGVAEKELSRSVGLDRKTLAASFASLRKAGRAEPTPQGTWIDAAFLGTLVTQLGAALDAYHRNQPLQPGMPAGALRGSLPSNVPPDLAQLALDRSVAWREAVLEDDRVRRPDHRATVSDEDQVLISRVLEEAAAAGLEPLGLRERAERHGVSMDRLRNLLAHLERQGRLVRARDDLWFDRPTIDSLRKRIVRHFDAHGSLNTKTYKDLIGTSRRTAVPLMEFFDDERLTMRRGEVRLLRKSQAV